MKILARHSDGSAKEVLYTSLDEHLAAIRWHEHLDIGASCLDASRLTLAEFPHLPGMFFDYLEGR